ncbi:MAG: hypothetical protein VXY46_06600, partial [Pseudomonadota bacterium]|nr:hypothetical protein [Pseudomonadota bacterium]
MVRKPTLPPSRFAVVICANHLLLAEPITHNQNRQKPNALTFKEKQLFRGLKKTKVFVFTLILMIVSLQAMSVEVRPGIMRTPDTMFENLKDF